MSYALCVGLFIIGAASFPDPALRAFQDGFTGRRVVRFSSDGRYLAWTADNLNKGAPAVRVWDRHKDEVFAVGELESNRTQTQVIAFTADGKVVTVTHKLSVWDMRTGQLLQEEYLPIAESGIIPALSTNGTMVAYATAQGTVKFASLSDLKNPVSLKEKCHPAATLCFSADGGMLIVADRGQVRVYNTAKRELVKTIDVPDAIDCVVLSKDQSLLAYAGFERFGLINLKTGNLERYSVRADPGATMICSTVQFSPDQKSILLGGAKLIRFDMTRKKIVTIRPLFVYGIGHHAECMDLHPDGKHFATGHAGRVQLWDYPELFK